MVERIHKHITKSKGEKENDSFGRKIDELSVVGVRWSVFLFVVTMNFKPWTRMAFLFKWRPHNPRNRTKSGKRLSGKWKADGIWINDGYRIFILCEISNEVSRMPCKTRHIPPWLFLIQVTEIIIFESRVSLTNVFYVSQPIENYNLISFFIPAAAKSQKLFYAKIISTADCSHHLHSWPHITNFHSMMLSHSDHMHRIQFDCQ